MPVAMGRHRGTGAIPPAVADRVLYDHVTVVVLERQPHRSPRHRPIRRGAPNMKVGGYEEEFPTWEVLVTDNGYMGTGVAPEHRGGGGEGTCGNYPGSKDQEAGPPVPSLL